jgi:uncharacterized protein YjbI with pentapeptide repeats
LDQVKKGDRYFSKIKFEEGMDLSGVDLQNLSFYACEMPGAKFDGAKLALTEFSRMSLATATGLERALNLGFAIFMRNRADDFDRKGCQGGKTAAAIAALPES